MRPTHLTPPHRIPIVGTRAIGHHDAGTRLPQQVAGHVATTGPPSHAHGHPTRRRAPSPGVLATLTPPRRVAVGHGVRRHGGPGVLDWCRHRCRRGLCPWADRPHTQGHPAAIVEPRRGQTVGPALGPRTPRDRGVDPWTLGATGDPCGPGRSCPRAACGAHQLRPWLGGHHRRAGRALEHWMPPRRGSLSRAAGVAAGTLRGLADHDLIDCLHRPPGTRRARRPWLTTATARAPRPPRPWMR